MAENAKLLMIVPAVSCYCLRQNLQGVRVSRRGLFMGLTMFKAAVYRWGCVLSLQ
jgi:hypothetical protein